MGNPLTVRIRNPQKNHEMVVNAADFEAGVKDQFRGYKILTAAAPPAAAPPAAPKGPVTGAAGEEAEGGEE